MAEVVSSFRQLTNQSKLRMGDVSRTAANKKVASHVTFKLPTHIDNLLQTRVYSAYTKGRKDPREGYEESITEREWWRAFVKETPVPGHYKYRDFLYEGSMNPIQATYNFAGRGRSREPGVAHKGVMLLPGLYQHSDFIKDLKRRRAACSFKSSGRARTPPGFQDKDLHVPPWRYNTTTAPKKPPTTIGSSAFRSQSKRFPSNNFKPHEGPPPGSYDPSTSATRYAVSSCFRSGTPRFSTAHTKVPGPGTYEPTLSQGANMGSTSTISKMGRMHGLFFRNTFET
uniref:Protein STPG4 n=1 Tax=Ciona savignyi TaxID=51511 RepID=H2ZBA7_CIOSA